MAKRQWTDYTAEEKAAALAKLDANHGNVTRTARELSIPGKTLEGWAKGRHVTPKIELLREKKREDLATRYDEIAQLALDRVKQLIPTANLEQAFDIANGSVSNKQLLTGQPTVRTEQGAPGDYSSKVDELRRKRNERKAG